jgi:LysM repeat protein
VRPSRVPFILGLTCLVALALLGLTVGLAQAQKPIITTPTPTPLLPPRPHVPEAVVPSQVVTPTVRLPLTTTLPSEVSAEAFTYTVGISDTLWTLALNFGRDLDTIACATRPRGDDAATLISGQVVTIPALRDLCYTVTPGDTLAGIAARYGLTVDQIVAVRWNDLMGPPYNIQPRQRILLPGARRIAPVRPPREVIQGVISVPNDQWAKSPWPNWPYGDGHFIWPVVGPVSQGSHAGHHAIDIAVDAGTPVQAADRGTVIMAGWSPVGYGFRVVIDHHIDYVTLYAHMSDIYVQEGQVVAKGQVIGVTGANGNVTGPHLHFEIRDFGILVDPLTLLPK